MAFDFRKVTKARRIHDIQRLQRFLALNNESAKLRRRTSTDAVERMDTARRLAVRHNLTRSQEQELRWRLQSRTPLAGIRGAMQQGGLVTAIKYGRIGNRMWGSSMFHRKGGLALAYHAPHLLRQISRLGVRARQAARLRRLAEQAADQEQHRIARFI